MSIDTDKPLGELSADDLRKSYTAALIKAGMVKQDVESEPSQELIKTVVDGFLKEKTSKEAVGWTPVVFVDSPDCGLVKIGITLYSSRDRYAKITEQHEMGHRWVHRKSVDAAGKKREGETTDQYRDRIKRIEMRSNELYHITVGTSAGEAIDKFGEKAAENPETYRKMAEFNVKFGVQDDGNKP